MSKRKSITLLTILSVLMAAIIALTFVRFSVGVKDYNSLLGAIKQDYDIAGGVAYTLTLNENNDKEVGDINSVVKTLESRLDKLGHTTYMVKPIKSTDSEVIDSQIRIEILNNGYTSGDVMAAAAYGTLKFYGGESSEDLTTQILKDIDVVESASYMGQNENDAPILQIVFTEEGEEELLKAVGDKSTYYLKATCGLDKDGEEITVLNLSFDKQYLIDRTISITVGSGSVQQTKQMAMQLTEGGIAYRYDISDGEEVQSPYGEDIGVKCVIAIGAIVLVAIILLFVLYRGLGVMTVLSFILFILAEGWLLIGIPGITVNLGSIVGIIAAILICLFSMVTLAQRIKNEYANSEKTAKAAINKGFSQALLPTINLHVVAGIIIAALFIAAKGVVKSFAITCGIGIIVSFIATLVFTRMFNSLVLPLVKDKEKFLRFKRAEKVNEEA
ncbi:MAG: hypothetical protein E7348_06250 [Clostridiales bacterium]|nr:hypothetical protein [Clostridiales bacterium]